MGGGNGQKSAMRRAKKLEELAGANKGSQLKANAQSMTIKCNICMTAFVCTTSEKLLREHWENKHPKQPIEQAFPQLKTE
ncbi:hypothetical protein HYH03_008207 [Edaphochlamys debaryana]|uniref:Uncharacterized protein n=1 Tax=Edaphochlamys debaryana TaxID=47281 RepID=A0A836BZR9_9CHLO|nr:hypothetical protein HYH03_008207 [Edaphochlamys debaryana]|eukprot:KAG2493693.1 hypothetical protein HYH03_008207 [Edaphochlamys debaryana]